MEERREQLAEEATRVVEEAAAEEADNSSAYASPTCTEALAHPSQQPTPAPLGYAIVQISGGARDSHPSANWILWQPSMLAGVNIPVGNNNMGVAKYVRYVVG